jgi:hypothetical protein
MTEKSHNVTKEESLNIKKKNNEANLQIEKKFRENIS